jgi:hypothetical protein
MSLRFLCLSTLVSLTSASLSSAESSAPPAWYVRKATARETYEASRQSKGRKLSLGPWYYVGPFDNNNGQGFAAEYPPEKAVDLKATYEGKKKAPLQWQRGDKFQDDTNNDLRIFPDSDNMTVYLYRTITCPAPVDLPVVLGSDDTLTVWLNGKKLLANQTTRSCNLGDDKLTLPLQQGENHLLLKVCQGGGGAGFGFGVSSNTAAAENDALMQMIAKDFPDQIGALRKELLVERECAGQWAALRRDLANRGWFKRWTPHACRPESLVLESDRDPLDIVLRRTTALLAALQKTSAAPKLAPMETALQALTARAAAADVKDQDARLKLFTELSLLRRQIAFANPLLDFDKILFAKHHFKPPHEGLGNHMCDQYFGFHAVEGGGVYVLENAFSDTPTVRDIAGDAVCTNGRFQGKKLTPGAFLSPTLSYDAQTLLFAYTEADHTRYKWTPKSTWHIFKIGCDGSQLTQLTDGSWNDFDPCFLPNGRVVFISERRGGFGRCHGRPVPTYTLHTMQPDGSDIQAISFHETNEWHPSVNNDGMVVYTRWDYVDRGFNNAHHPWITTPDGRDARVIQGNYAKNGGDRPLMEMHVRAIPGSRRYVSTTAAHHGQAYGALIVIDPVIPDDDAMASVKVLTPETGFPESSVGSNQGQVYGTAWPLSEDFFLCVYDPDGVTSRGTDNRYGVYLIDSFGNRELLYRDPAISCLNPIPLKARKAPPVVPPAAAAAPVAATAPAAPQAAKVGVVNVYDSLKPWPDATKIKALRIIQVLPKTTPSANNPRIGYGDQKNARRVLGTVPVETDGSAYFTLPVHVPVFFQALDEQGLAVQSMKSDTYAQPGETLMCQGCHNPTHKIVASTTPSGLAFRRAPSVIAPDVEGSNPFSFPRLVQPILDRACVDCHAKSKDQPKAMDLAKGDFRKNPNNWYTSYANLRNFAHFADNAGWTEPRTIPGRFGARASRLYQLLLKDHYGVKLTPDELHRIALWLDCNSDFFGAYEHTVEQAEGKIVQPSLE